MNNLLRITIVVFSLLLISCTDEDVPTHVSLSVEDRINAERPISSVYVYSATFGSWGFTDNQYNKTLEDAYAENGHLVVVTKSKKYLYNLSNAAVVETSEHSIILRY